MTDKVHTENSKRAESKPITKITKDQPAKSAGVSCRNNYLLTTSSNFLKYSEPEFYDYLTYLKCDNFYDT